MSVSSGCVACLRVCTCWHCPARQRAEQTAAPVGRETQLDVWLQLTVAKLRLVPAHRSQFTDTRCCFCVCLCARVTRDSVYRGAFAHARSSGCMWASTWAQKLSVSGIMSCIIQAVCLIHQWKASWGTAAHLEELHHRDWSQGGSMSTWDNAAASDASSISRSLRLQCAGSQQNKTNIINNKVDRLVSVCLRIHLFPH